MRGRIEKHEYSSGSSPRVRAGPETRGYLDPGHEPLKSQGVKAPGEDEKNWEMSENDQAVDPKEETHLRALAARVN